MIPGVRPRCEFSEQQKAGPAIIIQTMIPDFDSLGSSEYEPQSPSLGERDTWLQVAAASFGSGSVVTAPWTHSHN